MNSKNKKAPGAGAILPPFKRQTEHTPQIKSGIAQLKTGVSAQSVKRPVTPPVYRPQAEPVGVQAKITGSSQMKNHLVAPLIYKPPLVPKVLQTQKTVSQQTQSKPLVNGAATLLRQDSAVQRKKGGKGAREQQKQLRKKANQKVDQGKLSGWKMWSTAVRGKDSVSAESGTDTTESQRIDTYIKTAGVKWPWDGKPDLEGRPHQSCAEAHVYALLIEAKENPKTYTLKSYNSQGKLAPPCLNCKTWVGTAFKSVDGLNANYRSESTKSTKWAGPGKRWED